MPSLAQLIRDKYPGAYDDLSDADLEKQVVAKYPQYRDLVPLVRYGGPLTSVVPKETQLRAASAIAGSNQAPLKREQPGSTAASLADIAVPITSIKEGLKAIPDVVRGLGNNPVATIRGGAAGVTEGALDLLSPLNIALAAFPTARRLFGKAGEAAPVVDRYAPNIGGAEAAAETLPARGTAIVGEPAMKLGPTGRPAGKAPTLQETIQEALDNARKSPENVGTTAPEPTLTKTGKPAITGEAYDALQGKPAPGTPAPKSGTLPPPEQASLDALDAIHEDAVKPRNASSKALQDIKERRLTNQGPLPGMTDRRMTELAQKFGGRAPEPSTAEQVATHLEKGNVNEAAATIEKKTKLTVTELARSMRDQYGSQRAGKMLQPNQPARAGAEAIKRLAPGPSQMPAIVKEAIAETSGLMGEGATAAQRAGYATTLQKYGSGFEPRTALIEDLKKQGAPEDFIDRVLRALTPEGGGVNPKLLASGGGAVVGAAAGGTQGDTTEDHVVNALMGGAAGAIIPLVIANVVASGKPMQALKNYWFSALLSRPTSVFKAYLGGVGGAATAAADLAMKGDVRGAQTIIEEMSRTGTVRGILGAVKRGGAMSTGFTEQAPTITGRIYDAVNEPAMRAMMKAGLSRDDAMRYTLAGLPRTPVGRTILQAWNQVFFLKALGSMFPRVGVQILEHGVERLPASAGALESAGFGGLAPSTGKALSGAGVALASYAGAQHLPKWSLPFVEALSGPYALLSGPALAAGAVKGDASQKLSAGTGALADYLPFPRYGPAEALKEVASGSSFVPGIVGDIARARDPYDRKAAGYFGRTKSKIPGLRETLPIRGGNVNIAGQPTEDRTSVLKRFLSNPAREGEPMKGVPEPIVSELNRLGISINAPSYEKELKVGKRTVQIPPDLAQRSRTERRQYLLPQIQKAMTSRTYRQADDERKRRILTAVIKRAEDAGNQRARATLVKSLRESGVFGASAVR